MAIVIIRGGVLLIAGFLNLILAFFLFSKRKGNKPAFHLSLSAFFSALYCFICALVDISWQSSISYSLKLFWNRCTWLGLFILPPYLNFVYHFTGKSKHIKLKSFCWYLGASVFSYLALTTPYFIESLQIDKLLVETPGKLEPLGRLYIIFGAIVGLGYILRDYFQSRGYRRLQLRYFILGIVIYSIGGGIFTGILPLIQRQAQFFDMTGLFSVFWVGLTSYAILRYRLMDIRIALGKAVSFLLSFLTALLAALLLIYVNYQLPTPLSFAQLLPFVLLLCLGLWHLSRFYEEITSFYFYPGFFKRKIILENLEEELTSLLEMKDFSFLLSNTLMKAFDLEGIAVLTKVPRKKAFSLQKTIGFKERKILKLSENETLLSLLRKYKKPLGLQEIDLFLKRERKTQKREMLKDLKQKIEKSKIEIIVPLLFERKPIGMIVLGQKITKEAFSKEDIDLLKGLAHQASIALKNTLLYSEVKKRKEELERFYRLTVGRELKMVELKKKILELEEKLKEKEK